MGFVLCLVNSNHNKEISYVFCLQPPDDHARGLSTFTVMAGLGGFFGYALGGINWDETSIGKYVT